MPHADEPFMSEEVVPRETRRQSIVPSGQITFTWAERARPIPSTW
jgi:hypothetical protein